MKRPRLVAAVVGAGLLILGITFLRGRQDSASEDSGAQDAPGEDPGYVALDAVVTETTANGTPLYTLRAARMEQETSSGDVVMDRITMSYAGDPASGDAPNEPWTLRADRGQMRGGTNLVELRGSVRVQGKPPGSQLDARVATEQLDFDTKTQDIATMANVTFSWGDFSLPARGFRGNLQQEHARLESGVHGRFSR